MNEAQIAQLETQIEESLEQFSSAAEKGIKGRAETLTQATRELIDSYSNQIRNLSIVSGVIAPFSLTLLEIQGVKIEFLLIGFTLLLVNIVLAQVSLAQQLDGRDRNVVHATIEHMSATLVHEEINNKNIPCSERVLKTFDFIKNTDEIDRLLGATPYNTELMQMHGKLRKCNRWSIAILSTACAFIISAVIFGEMVNLLSSFFVIVGLG